MIESLLTSFDQHEPLKRRILHVFYSLPEEVQQDFANDPRFSIALDNYAPGKGSTVFMAAPGGTGDGSRSVILKPRLAEVDEAFAHYVIAHEFAHAFLRNGPWGNITNVEEAADALAESWGFPTIDWRRGR